MPFSQWKNFEFWASSSISSDLFDNSDRIVIELYSENE